MKHRIAILYHETQRRRPPNYLINQFAELWRADGLEVVELFGIGQFVPADLVIVHVDLSVVPDEYLEFAKRYPKALNGAVKDIRKSTFSQLLIKPGDPYAGPVIVKSDLNYAGFPERLISEAAPAAPLFRSPLDYRVFECLAAVPAELAQHPAVIVEKFMPEKENGLFIMRAMLFLGDRVSCARMTARHPIVNGTTHLSIDYVEPHPDIVARRAALKFDYGKFDYVIHDGQALLLDTNKTIGAGTMNTTPDMLVKRRHRADGIYSYLEGAA